MNKLWNNNKGMTLIEVLLVLVILSIASVTIYSTFTTGLKLYQKIAIEGQLRDDADYIATMILNQLYENTPNYIEPYNKDGATGIRMVRFKPKTVEHYVIEESTIFDVNKVIYFKDNNFYIRDETDAANPITTKLSSDSSIHTTTIINGTTETNFIDLDIGNNCSEKDISGNCQHGIIKLNLVLKDSKERFSKLLQTDPIVLKSSFGF